MPDPTNLTVEEAADQLGASVATVRRWCKSGRIAATKAGREWVIDGSKLPKAKRSQRGSRPSPGSGVDLEASLVQLRSTDLKEVWVPDILRFEDWLAASDDLLSLAASKLDSIDPPDPLQEVDVPKSPVFTRGAALLSLPDRLALHASVASLASRVEAMVLPSVYSARLSDQPKYLLKKGRDQWVKWKDAVLAEVDSGAEWVVKTDVTSYFDNIQLRLLMGDIDALNPDPKVSKALRIMLNEWAPMPGAGIPQGPNVCRILGNLYMVPVDQAMVDSRWKYFRFLDDIRVAARSRSDAIAGAKALEKECRRRGLFLSAQKTKLLSGKEVRADFEDSDMRDAQYLINISLHSQAKPILKRIIKNAVKKDGSIADKRARFSLWRLGLLRDQYALSIVLKNLENFAPIASIVAAYLTPWISRSRVELGITTFVHDPQRNTSPFLSTWLLAAMLERRGDLPVELVSYARVVARDRNASTYHRAVAASVMARSGDSADVGWLKRELKTEWDPALLRAYLVALCRAVALDKADGGRAESRVPDLARTVAYLRGRRSLPSLIYGGMSVPLPGEAG